MKGKLIKMVEGWTLSLTGNIDDLYAISNHQLAKDHQLYKLSSKNCQAIEKGYDFDEYGEGVFYAGQFGHPSPEGFSDEQIGRLHGFIDGFQKALEILKKQFTEEDMIAASKYGYDFRATTSFPKQEFEDSCINNTKQWIQYYSTLPKQNEWDVQIEMIGPLVYTDDLPEDDEERPIYKPKLDENGCLILKRI